MKATEAQLARWQKNLAQRPTTEPAPPSQEPRSEFEKPAVPRKPRKRSTRASKPREYVWVWAVKWGVRHRFRQVDANRTVTFCGHEAWTPTTLAVDDGTAPTCEGCKE